MYMYMHLSMYMYTSPRGVEHTKIAKFRQIPKTRSKIASFQVRDQRPPKANFNLNPYKTGVPRLQVFAKFQNSVPSLQVFRFVPTAPPFQRPGGGGEVITSILPLLAPDGGGLRPRFFHNLPP